jgi:DNA-binding NtrC family response regulator
MDRTEEGSSLSILVIDDDPDILGSIRQYLEDRGHRVFLAHTGEEGLRTLEKEPIDIVITDVKMPGMDGFEVLRRVKAVSSGTDVIIITGYREIENAFRAMREGAFDFFTKPLKVQDLSASLQRTARFRALRQERDRIQARLDRLDVGAGAFGVTAILGASAAIQEVRQQITTVGCSDDTSVVVCGETGTGKELVARAIHTEGARADGPFVAVDCSALPPTLIEDVFYGHERGAFTDARDSRGGVFEQAHGGTLFLDEIGDMDPGAQTRLLRTLEARSVRRLGGSKDVPVDVRVVSATNRDLGQATAEGRFREDLLYRLNTVTISVPPLRERADDIQPLATHFLERYSREMRKQIGGFAPDALSRLLSHTFPGNVRELRNLVERAVIFCSGDRVMPGDLEFQPDRHVDANKPGTDAEVARDATRAGSEASQLPDVTQASSLILAEYERALVTEALKRAEGNLSRAARLLGVSREVVRTRMEKYELMPQPIDPCSDHG